MQVLNSLLQQIYIHSPAKVNYNEHWTYIIKVEFDYFSKFNTIYYLCYLTAGITKSFCRVACNIQKFSHIKLSTNNCIKHVTNYNIMILYSNWFYG